MSEQIHFVELRLKSDFELLEPFAAEIWRSHYTSIIGADQVAYMLEKYQSAAMMLQQQKDGVRYFWIKVGDENVGYLAFKIDQNRSVLFVSKLYVHQRFRSLGIGHKSIDFLKETASANQTQHLELTVNKDNLGSIAFYAKMGFEVVSEKCVSIGNGFVMDDYLMRFDCRI